MDLIFTLNVLEISHLAFADDLFILSSAIRNSVELIRNTMGEFSGLSGLRPNSQECNIFIAGMRDQEAEALSNILEMPKATLPVTYLGIPLIPTKLTYGDCQPIFNKI